MSSTELGLIDANSNLSFISRQWTSNVDFIDDNNIQQDTLNSYISYKFKNQLLLPVDSTSNSQHLSMYGGTYQLEDNRDTLYLQTSNYALLPSNDWREYSNLTISGWFKTSNLANNDEIFEFGDTFYYDTSNLIAWYKFEDSTNLGLDSVNGYNMTLTGTPTYSSSGSRVGKGYIQFPTTTQYARIPTAVLKPGGVTRDVFSISFWLKRNEDISSGYKHYITVDDGVNFGANSLYFGKTSGQNLQIYTRYGANIKENTVPLNQNIIGEWQHYVVILKKNNVAGTNRVFLSFYVNGQYIIAFNNDVNWIELANFISINRWINGTSDTCNKDIDDLRFYNKELSAEEVRSLYFNFTYKFFNETTNMLAWYKFNQDATNMLLDSSGNNYNLTNVSCTFNSTDYKVYNGCIQFSGTSYLTQSATVYCPSQVSICFWAFITANGFAQIITTQSGTTGWLIQVFNNNQLYYFISNTQAGIFQFGTSGNPSYNTWFHFVLTLNSTTNTHYAYVNGALKLTINCTYTPLSQSLSIGAQLGTPTFYMTNNNKLNDVRIYNRVLTANEVNMLYSTTNTLYNSRYNLTLKKNNNLLSFNINDITVYETPNIFDNTWNHFVWNILDSASNLSYIKINNSEKNYYNQITLAPQSLSLYPPSALSGYSTTIDGITYRACAYDYFHSDGNYDPWKVFDRSNAASSRYTSMDAYFQNGALKISGYSFGNDAAFKGIYFGIDMGQRIVMKQYKFTINASFPGRCPRTWKIYATNDDRCWNATGGKNRTPSYNTTIDLGWNEIDYKVNQYTYTDNILFNIPNNNSGYRFYAISVNAVRGSTDANGGYYLDINDMYIYGYSYLSYQNRLGSPNNKGNVFYNDFRVHTNTLTTQFEENLFDIYTIQNTFNVYSLNENQIITLSREELSLNTLQYNAYSNLTISSWIKIDNFADNDVILEISNEFYNDITNLYFWYKFNTNQFLKNYGIAGSTYNLIPSAGNNTVSCQSRDMAYGDASANFSTTAGYLYTQTYNFSTLFNNAISISFWLKRKGINTNWDNIFFGIDANLADNTNITISRFESGNYWFLRIFGHTTNTNGTLNDFVADNVWNHYVVIAEKVGTQVKISFYKNASFVHTNTSGTWTPPNTGIRISSITTGFGIQANIDDLRIYNKSLTQNEIINLYENSIVHIFYQDTSDLITWYKFDDSVTNMLLDSSGKFNHLTNNDATFDTSSYELGNGAIYFNGSAYVELPATVNPSTIYTSGSGITFAFWFKMSTSTGSYGRIMDFADNAPNTNATNQIIITKNSTLNSISLIINDQTYTTSTNFVDNNWHHLVWSIASTGSWILYIDNINFNIAVTKTIPVGITWQRRYLGRPWTSWDSWMIGNLDDFRIYKKVLTANEVSIIYNSYSSSRNLTTNLQALYPFDDVLTLDNANNNNLTNTNVQRNTSDYILGTSSAQFNGSSYFQITNDGRFSPDIFTVCCWCKIVQGSDYQTIVSCRNGQNSGWSISVNASQNLEFWCMNGTLNGLGTSLYNAFASNPAIWRHLAISFVKSPNEVKVYVDNVLLTTTTRTYTNNTSTSLRIGTGANETTPMFYLQNGSLLDDFRFYNRVLSAIEISAIYNLRNTKIIRNNFSLKKINNLLSFQINDTTVCNIPYLDNIWNHILWNINNNFQSQGFVRINHGTKNFYINQSYSIFEYPPASLNSASGTNTSKSLTLSATYTDGLYIVSSSTIVDSGPEKAFNKIPINNSATDNDRWISAATYNASGVYTGAVSTTYTLNNTTISYAGEWIQIQLPSGIVVTSYSLSTEYSTPSRGPKDFVVLGSINGSTWNLVNIQKGITGYSGNTAKQFTIYSVNAYSYYRLCINTTNNGTSAGVGEWRLYGYPTVAQNMKLASITNAGDLNLYDFKIITNQLTTQIENDLYNYYIPESFDHIKYNNIQIYSDKIKISNTSVTNTTPYLNYKFQNNQYVTTDNSSNTRHLNISNISYINDQNKNCILIRPNTEATFANDNWLSYSDLTVSGWFKNTRSNDGDDIILEMTTNQISRNNFFNDITNLYFWYKLNSIDFTKNFGLTGKDYDLIASSGSTIYPQKTDKAVGDASANFTSSGGFLYVPQYNFATNFSGAITIAFWLKRKGLQTTYDVILYAFTNSAANGTIIIQRNSTTSTWTYTLFGISGNTSAPLNDYRNDNVWNHYVWVIEKYGTTSVKLTVYKNAVSVFMNIGGTWTPPNQGFMFSFNNSVYTFIGNIDDFRIYNKALSQAEVNILCYNEGFYNNTANLIAWYQFNDNNTNMLLDSSGNNNQLISNSSTSILFDSVVKKYGTGSLNIIAKTEYLSHPLISLSARSFTIAFWLRLTGITNNSSGDSTIISNGSVRSTRQYLLCMWRNNFMLFAFFGDDLSSPTYDYTYINNVWVHWVFTYDVINNQRRIYKDGLQVASGTSGGSLSLAAGTFRISQTYSYSGFQGNLDDLRIYNRPLTATEVQQLYTQNNDTPYSYIVKRLNNTVSFQMNNIPIYETPYTNDTWTHFIWNINNSISHQGYFKINNGARNYFNEMLVNIPILKYPMYNLTSDFFTYPHNQVIIRTSGSTRYLSSINYSYYQAFNIKSPDLGWASALNTYNTTTGIAVNTYRTGYAGEYLQIDLVESILLSYYIIYPRIDTNNNRNPGSFRVYASNNTDAWTNINHISWILIDERINLSYYSFPITCNVSNNKIAYRFYVIIINKTTNAPNTQGIANVTQWQLFGYPSYSYTNRIGSINNQGTLYISDFNVLTRSLTASIEKQLFSPIQQYKTIADESYVQNQMRSMNALYYNTSKKLETNVNGVNIQGTLTSTGAISSFFSDMRLKERISPIDHALHKINNIETFKYIPNKTALSYNFTNNNVHVGLSAQNIQNILPEVVDLAPFDTSNLEDGSIVSRSGNNYLSVSYESLVPLLLESIKELKHKFDYLKNQKQTN